MKGKKLEDTIANEIYEKIKDMSIDEINEYFENENKKIQG